jgi:hypothetical protein
MASYINIWKERNVVVSQAYDCDYGRWIYECEYMAAIENNDGRLVTIPLMCIDDYNTTTADDMIKNAEDEKIEILMKEDCPARDSKIKNNITEWICNEGCVSNSSIVEAVCVVVSTLTRNGMWKDEYSKCIDINKIKEEYGEKD